MIQNVYYDDANLLTIRMKETTEHRAWAGKFFFCEVLNFVNVIGQIYFTDTFLGGEFRRYGSEVKWRYQSDIMKKFKNHCRIFEYRF